MKKLFTFLTAFFFVHFLMAQSVGIGTTTPNASAGLDITAANKGLLIPRVSLTSLSDVTTVPSPALSLLVFNTNNALAGGAGFYTWGGSSWVKIITGVDLNKTWKTDGNSGTNPATDFIGTTDNVPLVFRSGNVLSGFTDPIQKNVYFGIRAGLGITTGVNNTGLGTAALRMNDVLDNLVAVGDSALYENNLGPGRNTAVGYRAGRYTADGGNNTFIGSNAGYTNNNGNRNTAIGSLALSKNTTGYRNVGIGASALLENDYGYKNIAIGSAALKTAGYFQDNNIAIGDSVFSDMSGYGNIGIGHEVAEQPGSSFDNVFIGKSIGAQATDYGHENIGIGTNLFFKLDNGWNNIAIGNGSLFNTISGSNNIGIGRSAASSNTTGEYNLAIGYQALYLNQTAGHNIAIGDSALKNQNGGLGLNTVVGAKAAYQSTNGNENSFFGSNIASANTSGSNNVAVGSKAYNETVSSNGNTAVGYQAGDNFDMGNNNTLIGSATDVSANGFVNSTALGYNATITASNQVRIGTIGTTSIGGYQNWTNISDGRFKTNIKQNVPGLDFVTKLQPVTYNLDIDGLNKKIGKAGADINSTVQSAMQQQIKSTVFSGFIAQEVEAAAKALGYSFSGVDAPKNDNDFYGLRYADFVVPLVKSVQELAAENNALKLSNSQLQEKLDALVKRIELLEKK